MIVISQAQKALIEYNSFISKIKEFNELIKAYENYLAEAKEDLKVAEKELSDLEKKIVKEKEGKLLEYTKEQENKETEELRKDLEKQTKEYEDLKLEKQNEIDSISPESISEEYTKKYLGVNKLGDILENLKERFRKIYGDEVYNVLSESIVSERMTDNDLQSLIKFIREYHEMYNDINITESSVIIELEESVYSTLKPLPDIDVPYIIAIVVMFASLHFLKYPLIVGLTLIVVMNFTTYLATYTKFVKFTKMYVNYDNIKALLVENAKELCKQELELINNKYDDRLESYENCIEEINEEIKEVIDNLEIDENIPYTTIDRLYKVQLSEAKSRIKEINENVDDTKNNMEETKTKLSNHMNGLNEAKAKLQSAFIKSDFGKEALPLTQILIGYEDDGYTPVTFDFNKKSTLLTYDGSEKSYKAVVELFKMIILQQLFSMRAGNVFFNVVDDVYMCKDFQIFTDKTNDIVTLCTMSNDISAFLSKSIEELKVSQHAVRESADIDKFNKHMLSIDSTTHYYIFNLFLNYPKDIFKTEHFIKLMTVGNSAGIYNIIALSRQEDIEEYKEVLNYVQETIILESII